MTPQPDHHFSERIERERVIAAGPVVDYSERCRCGHTRAEHNRMFGCMQWDERRQKGWCDCDGFQRRR